MLHQKHCDQNHFQHLRNNQWIHCGLDQLMTATAQRLVGNHKTAATARLLVANHCFFGFGRKEIVGFQS